MIEGQMIPGLRELTAGKNEISNMCDVQFRCLQDAPGDCLHHESSINVQRLMHCELEKNDFCTNPAAITDALAALPEVAKLRAVAEIAKDILRMNILRTRSPLDGSEIGRSLETALAALEGKS